jgi:hypothetical protein
MRSIFIVLGIAAVLAMAEPNFAYGAPGGGGRGGAGGGARPGGINGGYGGYRGGYYGGYRGGYYGGGFYPYGIGIGIGIGIYDTPWLYAEPSVRVVPIPALPTIVPQDPNAAPPLGTDTGMKILNVEKDGPAAKGLLRVGDTILSVGTNRVQTFDELRSALGPLNGAVDIVFINGENGKREKLPVKVANGRIGATVQEVQLPAPAAPSILPAP